MKISKLLMGLSFSSVFLGLIAAFIGLFWQNEGHSFFFTTLYGQEVEMFGRGIYHLDSLTSAATYTGTDAVTILLMTPLMVIALLRYRRGSLRGALLLACALSPFLYNSFHMAFAAAYNPLFLLYTAFFSTSLFAFLLACKNFDLKLLAARISPGIPRRGPAIFLMVAGTALAFVWLSDLVPAMMQNQAPLALGSATTLVTYALDLGFIVPSTWLAGILILRRSPLGYFLGLILIVLNAIVGIVVVSQTIAMIALGASLTPAMVVVFVAPFILMAFFAAWFAIGILKHIEEANV